MAKYTDEELASIVGQYLTEVDDYASTELEEQRRKALDYVFMRPRGDEIPGQSHVISGDVPDMIESIIAQVMPSFASDNPCEFEPMGEDDEEQAPAESMAVNGVLMEDNQGYQVLQDAIRDALMFGNGTVKCWVDTKENSETRSVEGVTEEGLMLLQAEFEQRGMQMDVMSMDEDKARIRITETEREIRVKAVEQAMFIVDPNHDSMNFSEVDFVAERKIMRRSDLIEQGFDKNQVDMLPAFTTDVETDSSAKNLGGIEDHNRGETPDRDRIELFECYVRIDQDDDGISELKLIWYANREVLGVEDALFIPMASGSAFPVSHRYHGLSCYDKGRDIQDIKTHTLRNMIDNQKTNNVARTAVNDKRVNMDDMLSGRVNGVVRVDGIPAESIMPFPTNDTLPSSQSLLNYMDQVRAQRMGSSLDLQGGEEQLVKSNVTAMSVDRQLSEQEMIAGLIARNLAESLIRETFLLLHKVMRTDYPEPVSIQRAGEWKQVNPSEWPERRRVNVKLGLSPGERFRKAQSLSTVMQLQQSLMQQGGAGVVVDLNGMHRAALDWARAVEIDGAEKYFLDPESKQSQQAQQAMQRMNQQQQQQQLQMAMLEPQMEQQKQQFEQQMEQAKLQFEYWRELLKSEVEEAKIVQQATSELQKAQSTGEENTNGAQ